MRRLAHILIGVTLIVTSACDSNSRDATIRKTLNGGQSTVLLDTAQEKSELAECLRMDLVTEAMKQAPDLMLYVSDSELGKLENNIFSSAGTVAQNQEVFLRGIREDALTINKPLFSDFNGSELTRGFKGRFFKGLETLSEDCKSVKLTPEGASEPVTYTVVQPTADRLVVASSEAREQITYDFDSDSKTLVVSVIRPTNGVVSCGADLPAYYRMDYTITMTSSPARFSIGYEYAEFTAGYLANNEDLKATLDETTKGSPVRLESYIYKDIIGAIQANLFAQDGCQ